MAAEQAGSDDGPRVWVGPQAPEELLRAVEAGGGRPSEAAQADALVWYGGSPQDLTNVLHDGVRWVQLPAAGIETWLSAGVVDEARVWTSAVGCYATSVAEHTLAMMLATARDLHTLARASSWSRPRPRALTGATVGIVGAGGIGRELIRLLVPFDVRVLAVNRSGRPVDGAERTVPAPELDEVLAESDYVVVATPATAQTRALVGARELALMKPDACLVNIARGSLVDTDALVHALEQGRLGAAALDVTDPEPLPDGHPLWSSPRALISPHSANPESLQVPALASRVERNVALFAAGKELEGVVDLAQGY